MKLLGIFSFLILSGCGSYHSGFDCKAAPGMGCKSISEINSMLNRGNLLQQKADPAKIEVVQRNTLPFPQVIPNNLHSLAVYRQPETIIRIWLAPYIDSHDTYQEAQYIHEVIENGKWHEFSERQV